MTKEPAQNTEDREPNMDGSLMHDALVPGDDAWLESLLRADASHSPHIDDRGFSAGVMRALPAPRKAVNRWLVPAMAALGAAAAIGLTPAGGYFASHFLALFDLRHFSLTNLYVLVPVALLYVCSFAAVRER